MAASQNIPPMSYAVERISAIFCYRATGQLVQGSNVPVLSQLKLRTKQLRTAKYGEMPKQRWLWRWETLAGSGDSFTLGLAAQVKEPP